jgi:hypothetical protein
LPILKFNLYCYIPERDAPVKVSGGGGARGKGDGLLNHQTEATVGGCTS